MRLHAAAAPNADAPRRSARPGQPRSRRRNAAFALSVLLWPAVPPSGSRALRRFGVLVDLDEAQVVLGHLLGGDIALARAVDVTRQRVAPDRAADRDPDEAVDGRRLAQPLVDLVVA